MEVEKDLKCFHLWDSSGDYNGNFVQKTISKNEVKLKRVLYAYRNVAIILFSFS